MKTIYTTIDNKSPIAERLTDQKIWAGRPDDVWSNPKAWHSTLVDVIKSKLNFAPPFTGRNIAIVKGLQFHDGSILLEKILKVVDYQEVRIGQPAMFLLKHFGK